MKKQVLMAALIGASTLAQAGWMDALNAAAQLASTAQQGRQAVAPAAPQSPAAATGDTAPLTPYQLNAMNCAELELAALRTKQGLEDAKDQLKTLDAASQTAEVQQQRSTGQTLGLIGGLLAGSKSQTAQQYAQVAQQMSANTQAVDTQIDQQLALGKKYLADRDSIAIYQKHKGCSLR